MGTTRNRYFNLVFALVMVPIFSGRSAAADSKIRSEIAVRVYNYAQVNREILAEAEKVAGGIFEKAGVETRWIDVDSSSDPTPPMLDEGSHVSVSYMQLDILTREMFDRLGLPDNVMGLAPGAGPDRMQLYVSYSRAAALFSAELDALGRGVSRLVASRGQILGHVLAHEMGHILLNTANHSPSGIMRGVWDVNTWSDAFSGKMLFSTEQAEILRAEVLRRTAQREGNTVDGEEMARLIR